MVKYKIWLLDDEIYKEPERRYIFEAFLENKWFNYYKMRAEEGGLDVTEESLKKAIEPHAEAGNEFEVVYQDRPDEESLRKTIMKGGIDAIFLDVGFEKAPEKPDFFKVLSALERYMDTDVPPIFVYSGAITPDMIVSINDAFDRVFVGRGPDRLYSLNEIISICDSAHKRNGGKCNFERLIAARQIISNIISKKKNLASFFPKKDDELSILHISDLQFGDKKSSHALNGILNSISSKVGDIDLLVITGDIAMHGWKSEFIEAETFITKLRDKLWPKGVSTEEKCRRNHDVDLNMLVANYYDAIPIDNSDGTRQIDFSNIVNDISAFQKHEHDNYQNMSLQAFRNFAYRITLDSNYILCDTLNFANDRFINWGIRFLCLNSVGAISATEANKAFLAPDSDIIHPIDGVMSIALCHHTLLCESPGDICEKDADLFRKTLLGYITGNKCQILMGGHRHMSASEKRSTENSTDYLVCEAASLRLEKTDNNHIRALKKYVFYRKNAKYSLLDEYLYNFSEKDTSISEAQMVQEKNPIPNY